MEGPDSLTWGVRAAAWGRPSLGEGWDGSPVRASTWKAGPAGKRLTNVHPAALGTGGLFAQLRSPFDSSFQGRFRPPPPPGKNEREI